MSSKSRLRSVPAQSGNAASALVGATRADRQATRKAADEQRAREEGLRLSEEKRRAAHRPHIDAANLERYLVDDELGKIALSLAIKTEWHRVEQEEEYVDPLTKTEISGELHRFTSVHRTKDAKKQRLAIVRNIVARLGENVEGSVDAVIDSLNHAEYELKESIDASVASMNGKLAFVHTEQDKALGAFKACKAEHEKCKADFSACKAEYADCKAEHEKCKADFSACKAEHEKCKADFSVCKDEKEQLVKKVSCMETKLKAFQDHLDALRQIEGTETEQVKKILSELESKVAEIRQAEEAAEKLFEVDRKEVALKAAKTCPHD